MYALRCTAVSTSGLDARSGVTQDGVPTPSSFYCRRKAAAVPPRARALGTAVKCTATSVWCSAFPACDPPEKKTAALKTTAVLLPPPCVCLMQIACFLLGHVNTSLGTQALLALSFCLSRLRNCPSEKHPDGPSSIHTSFVVLNVSTRICTCMVAFSTAPWVEDFNYFSSIRFRRDFHKLMKYELPVVDYSDSIPP